MKKMFKKAMASVVATVTLAVGMTAMSSSAYWTTKTIYNSNNTAMGEGYLSVSSSSIYASTTQYSPNCNIWVYIDYAYGNHNTSQDNFGSSNGGNTCFVQWFGSNFTQARSIHTVNGYSTAIVMNVGG